MANNKPKALSFTETQIWQNGRVTAPNGKSVDIGGLPFNNDDPDHATLITKCRQDPEFFNSLKITWTMNDVVNKDAVKPAEW